MGGLACLARCINTSAMFSPACWRPVKYSAILQPAPVETIPLVNTPVRSSDGSRASRSTRMLVSSLWFHVMPFRLAEKDTRDRVRPAIREVRKQRSPAELQHTLSRHLQSASRRRDSTRLPGRGAEAVLVSHHQSAVLPALIPGAAQIPPRTGGETRYSGN